MNQRDVLDHGFVRLVDHMGSDLSVVRAARVSYNADWRAGENEDKDAKLIRYLLTNRHTSPFEAVVFTFEIKCPIFIARQWHRHRTWSYNEVSARYTTLDEGYYVPDPDTVGHQAKHNKQMREIGTDHDHAEWAASMIERTCKQAFENYRYMIDHEVPRELARSVLPLASYTRFFGTVNLHNLMHFLRLRLHEHSQYEITEYARAIKELITPHVPVTMEVFDDIAL